ncbi:MAG: endonuclease domain-containing protein [Polyangiaceae bacterium]
MRSRFRRPFDTVVLHKLAPRARYMRLEPTRSEAMLWSALRAAQLGVRFRRQVVLGPFIVDFFAPSVNLVVEVDGGVHAGSQQHDAARDAAFASRGIRVLRLAADLVERDLAHAVSIVRAALVPP